MLRIVGSSSTDRLPTRSLKLQTRCCNDIENDLPDVRLDADEMRRSDGHMRELVAKQFGDTACRCLELRRHATLDDNCHGMTFANRRTNIRLSQTVEQVIREDGYVVVADADVKPGDIAVYYEADNPTEIGHTGVVVRIEVLGTANRVPYVLSKWGRAGEYIHRVGTYPIRYSRIVFFREGQVRRDTA